MGEEYFRLPLLSAQRIHLTWYNPFLLVSLDGGEHEPTMQ